MATITKSIGTSSRDYSTITAWEADLDNTGIYTSGDDAVGECYNDSAFSGSVTVDGGSTVGLGSVTLSVASTERHDGSAGSGSVTSGFISFSNNARVYTVEWLEIKDTTGGISQSQNTTNKVLVARNNIVHNIYHNNSTHVAGISTIVGGGDAYNNVIYDIENGTGGAARKASGFNLKTGGGIQNWAVYNNTVYNTKVSNATDGLVYSYHFGDYSQYTLKNNIGIGVSVTGSTTATELKEFYTDSASSATLSNNLSSDSTASGTGSLTGKTAANQFVSTVAGSEDLHLKINADAIDAGVDLGTTPAGVQYDIDGRDRDAAGDTWDIGADEFVRTTSATITKSIGTSSRDYSTITAWEADLDNTGVYISGDDAVGECYNDSAFDEDFIIDGGGTVSLNSRTLTVASGEQHDGTEGSGVRIVLSANVSGPVIKLSIVKTHVKLIEVDINGFYASGIEVARLTITGETETVSRCIVHGCYTTGGLFYGIYGSSDRQTVVYNCIVYDFTVVAGGTGLPAYAFGGLDTDSKFLNCTVYNYLRDDSRSNGESHGFSISTGTTVKNCIALDIDHTGGLSPACFSASGSNISYNISSDSTASGTGSLTNKTAANQFVSTVAGSEDLHLLSTADAVGAGVDLATTSVDINGSDRNALAATVWDIGAHQYASTASIGTSSRDYSTITLWEADLDDTTVYGAGANAVGECYSDSNFTASTTINGGGTVGLSSITLTVHPDHRHDGTVGTGAHVTYSSGSNSPAFRLSIANTLVEWFSVKLNGTGNYGNAAIVDHTHNINYTTSRYIVGEGDTTERINGPNNGINVYGHYTKSHNNIIYNYMMANATSAGIYDHYGTFHEVYNNTVYNCPYGYNWTMRGNTTMKNNLVVGNNYADFTKGSNTGTVVSSNNLSSDSTATINGGSNHVTGAPVSRQFVSTLSGSEDLHLIFKSAAIDAGVDLGTSPDGVQYDIDGKNRDAEGSIWDIGAHEYGDNVIFGLLRV